jgi:hypothetical protein
VSTDPTFERKSILARARAYLLGGRVFDSIPDDQAVPRNEQGAVKPYAVIHYGTVYRLGTSRSLVGEEEQPHVLPITIQCYAAHIEAARTSAGAVRDLFVGWHASPGSDEITSPGGTAYRDRDAAGTPTLYVEAVALECVFNLGSNDGFVPSPGTIEPGGAPLADVQQIVDEALGEHIDDPEPHRAYDIDMPDLVVLYENHLI